MTIKTAVANTLSRWNREAEMNFCRAGRAGEKMESRRWANGVLMTGPVGCLSNQMIPRQRAVEMFRAGWKIIVD